MSEYLLFDKQAEVPWSLFGRYGEGGNFGRRLYANATHRYLLHRALLPHSGDVQLQTRMRIRSALGNTTPTTGLAIRHRGFRLSGEPPTQTHTEVWTSDPQTAGSDRWFSENTGDEYVNVSFIVQPPKGLGIDYVTWELVLYAGGGGYVDIDSVECRHRYGRTFQDGWRNVARTLHVSDARRSYFASVNNFGRGRVVTNFFGGFALDIRKGQSISATVEAEAYANMYDAADTFDSLDGYVGTGLVLGHPDLSVSDPDQWDYFDMGSSPIVRDPANGFEVGRNIATNLQLIARRDYTTVSLVLTAQPMFEPVNAWSSNTSMAFHEYSVTVGDFEMNSE